MNIFNFIKAKICSLYTCFKIRSHINKSSHLVLLYFLNFRSPCNFFKNNRKFSEKLGCKMSRLSFKNYKGFPKLFQASVQVLKNRFMLL